MAHIHLEDGSFSLFYALLWWTAAIILVGIAIYLMRSEKRPNRRKITLAAFCAAAVGVSTALVGQSLARLAAVHDAAAAVGEIDDPRGERIPIRIIRLASANPPAVLDLNTLGLDRLPACQIELWRSAVFGPNPQLKWIFQHLWFAIGTKILIC